MMEINKMIGLVNEATKDILSSQDQIGNARPEDNALVFAQIAQAKLLVVIAGALIELGRNSRARWEEDDKPFYPVDRQG